jgi:hypothetical protein
MGRGKLGRLLAAWGELHSTEASPGGMGCMGVGLQRLMLCSSGLSICVHSMLGMAVPAVEVQLLWCHIKQV